MNVYVMARSTPRQRANAPARRPSRFQGEAA
jgi:hypothetical protein